MPSRGPEASAIEAAYGDEIKVLFRALKDSLIGEPHSHETDQQALGRFKEGLNVAKRARQLALSAAAPALRKKKIKAKKLA
jgi:hypothetical protein